MLKVTLVVCTFRRQQSLARTLRSVEQQITAPDWQLELLVIDNDVAETARATVANFEKLNPRYAVEDLQGLSRARNRALEMAKGEIVVWTDDDVVLDPHWLTNLVSPIASKQFDATVGCVFPAPEVDRSYLGPAAYAKLACSHWRLKTRRWTLPPQDRISLLGAAMAIRADCHKKIGSFNVKLGAGSVFPVGEDSEYSSRLKAAGFKIGFCPNAKALHFFESKRARIPSLFGAAILAGRYERHNREGFFPLSYLIRAITNLQCFLYFPPHAVIVDYMLFFVQTFSQFQTRK